MAMGMAPIHHSLVTRPLGRSVESSERRLTAKPAKAVAALNGLVGEPADAALHGADARAVGADLADTGGNTRVNGAGGIGGGRGGRGDGGGGRISGAASAGVGVGVGWVAGDGTAGALTVLLDGERLELGVRLLGGGVDAEDHAVAAVVALAAVEPCRRDWLVFGLAKETGR